MNFRQSLGRAKESSWIYLDRLTAGRSVRPAGGLDLAEFLNR
jgi:hypothetical protein